MKRREKGVFDDKTPYRSWHKELKQKEFSKELAFECAIVTEILHEASKENDAERLNLPIWHHTQIKNHPSNQSSGQPWLVSFYGLRLPYFPLAKPHETTIVFSLGWLCSPRVRSDRFRLWKRYLRQHHQASKQTYRLSLALAQDQLRFWLRPTGISL